MADALPRVTGGSFSRIPLYDKRRDDLDKVLYMRDLLTAMAGGRDDARVDEIAHAPLFVSQYQTIDELFAETTAQETAPRHCSG